MIRIVIMPLDMAIQGFTVWKYEDGQDYYTVVVNEYLSKTEKDKTVSHELKHIKRGDFFSEATVGEIERSTAETR